MSSIMHRIAQRLGYTPRAAAMEDAYRAAQLAYQRAMQVAQAQQRTLLASLESHDVASWSGDGAHINASTEAGLARARARSRDAALNNPWARRFMGLLRRNVLGPRGMVYQSRLRDGAGRPRAAQNTALESAYEGWSKAGAYDVTGRYSRRAIDQLALRALAVDGEAFLVYHQGRGPYGLQVQLLPADAVPIHLRADLGGGRKIRQGIEIDGAGRVLAYHMVLDVEAAELAAGTHTPGAPGLARVTADRVLHLFRPEEVGQMRGIPWLAPGLKSAWQAQDFASSGLNKARESAKRGGWLQSAGDIDPGASVQSLTDGQVVPAGEGDAAGVPFATLHDGTWERLPHGMQAAPFESDYPNIEYGQFIKDALRNIACAWEVSYISLANDLEAVNYSSGQLGLEDETTLWREVQTWLEETWHRPLFERWLPMAMLAAPELSGLSYARIPTYLGAAAWQGHRRKPLDPLKHIEAQQARIAARLTSPQREIAADGDDPEEIVRELEEWQRLTAGLPQPDTGTPDQQAAAARRLAIMQGNG